MKKRLWSLAKLALALAILGAVGRRFYVDLQDVDFSEVTLEPGWLLLSGALYLLALSFSAGFWYHLLWLFGDRPGLWTTLRAYYIGHLGKYVPGKAWALMLRSGLVSGPGTRLGVAVITSFYEVLTSMAAGAFLAAIIFVFQPPTIPGLTWNPVLTGLLLLGLLAVPLLPGVFNLLVRRLAARFQRIEAYRLPELRHRTLAGGILLTAVGWLVMATGLWAGLRGVLPEPPAFTLTLWLHCAASLGLAYVAGFLAIVVPGGVGVREFFLLQMLRSEGPERFIALAVLIVRLVWTAAELVLAGVAYWIPGRRVNTPAVAHSASTPA